MAKEKDCTIVQEEQRRKIGWASFQGTLKHETDGELLWNRQNYGEENIESNDMRKREKEFSVGSNDCAARIYFFLP